jgi:hypothetical protein
MRSGCKENFSRRIEMIPSGHFLSAGVFANILTSTHSIATRALARHTNCNIYTHNAEWCAEKTHLRVQLSTTLIIFSERKSSAHSHTDTHEYVYGRDYSHTRRLNLSRVRAAREDLFLLDSKSGCSSSVTRRPLQRVQRCSNFKSFLFSLLATGEIKFVFTQCANQKRAPREYELCIYCVPPLYYVLWKKAAVLDSNL